MESKVLTFDFIPLPYATSYFFHMPNFLTQFLTSSSFGLVWKALNPTQSVKKQVSSDQGGYRAARAAKKDLEGNEDMDEDRIC